MAMRVVIIGAGQAGYAASTTMRKLDPEVRITLVGDEDHPPYDRPPLSKTVLTGPDDAAPLFLQRDDYAGRDIELLTGVRVETIDRTARAVSLSDGRTLPYDRLMIATGGRARTLSLPGGEAIRYLRTYADALELRRSLRSGITVLCIGAGVIGLEIAASAREVGAEVIVVEAGNGPMGRMLPQPERDYVLDMHVARGVDFRFGTTIARIEAGPSGSSVLHLSSGETVHADLVVAGIGLERNVEIAETAGLAVDGGILVDEFGRTSDPDIFAAGDVASFWHPGHGKHLLLESWHHALEHAAAVSKTIMGTPTAYAPVRRFWTDQYGKNIQCAGDFAHASSFVLEGERSGEKFTVVYLDDEGRAVFGVSVNDPRRFRGLMKSIAEREPVAAEVAAGATPLATAPRAAAQ